MRRAAAARAARIMVALGLAVAACGCSRPAQGGDNVTILVPWSGTELKTFKSVIIAKFQQANHGITINIESTRALTQEIGADLKQGNLPDVAVLPSIGAIGQYADRLRPLDSLVQTADYGAPWSSLMRAGQRHHVLAVPIKADVKSLIWYDPAVFHPGAPPTWSQLLALSTSLQRAGHSPWCLALRSAPTSGWPGTDWIADILLSRYGTTTYQKWASGKLSWNSGQVKHAWQLWGQLLDNGKAVYGGPDAALLMHVKSISPWSVHPPSAGCYLSHGTLVDEDFPYLDKNGKPLLKFGTDYNFFPFPSSSTGAPIQVSADFIGMFKGTASAKLLVSYLAKSATQRAWVHVTGADGFSANNKVQVSAYPDPATRHIAELLTPGKHELCFGASDAMSPNLSAAFDRAIQEYLADPRRLETILTELSLTQSLNPPKATSLCGPP